MNLGELERKLILAARANPPSDRVPYAFEKRISARLRARPMPEAALGLARAWWRATAPCVGIMLLLAGWAMFLPASSATGTAHDYSQELENTVLAVVDQVSSTDSL